MYLDAALRQHISKNVRVFTKSGQVFDGELTGLDGIHYLAYLFGNGKVAIIDTRNIESFMLDKADVSPELNAWVNND